MAAWIKMSLGTDVGLGPDDIELDGDPASASSKRGRSPPLQFPAHVYCDQMAGWMKMALSTEVNLRPGDVVLDGVAAPP